CDSRSVMPCCRVAGSPGSHKKKRCAATLRRELRSEPPGKPRRLRTRNRPVCLRDEPAALPVAYGGGGRSSPCAPRKRGGKDFPAPSYFERTARYGTSARHGQGSPPDNLRRLAAP